MAARRAAATDEAPASKQASAATICFSLARRSLWCHSGSDCCPATLRREVLRSSQSNMDHQEENKSSTNGSIRGVIGSSRGVVCLFLAEKFSTCSIVLSLFCCSRCCSRGFGRPPSTAFYMRSLLSPDQAAEAASTAAVAPA